MPPDCFLVYLFPPRVECIPPQRTKWLADDWAKSFVIGSIPQVEHTFSSIEGLYGIVNEKQVLINDFVRYHHTL